MHSRSTEGPFLRCERGCFSSCWCVCLTHWTLLEWSTTDLGQVLSSQGTGLCNFFPFCYSLREKQKAPIHSRFSKLLPTFISKLSHSEGLSVCWQWRCVLRQGLKWPRWALKSWSSHLYLLSACTPMPGFSRFSLNSYCVLLCRLSLILILPFLFWTLGLFRSSLFHLE